MIPSVLACLQYSDIVLEVHTVGYPDMGESIVTFLKDGPKVLLTLVTDCYKEDDVDEVRDILVANGHPNIDFFIWTHPDKDHSVGIEELLDEFDSGRKATVYMPGYMTMGIIPCDAGKAAFSYLMSNYNRNRKYQLVPIATVDDQVVTLNRFELLERRTNRRISCALQFLLPDATLIMRRSNCGAGNPGDMNDFSLVYVLELNGVRYFFGGDMSKQSIQFLERKDQSFCENIRFVKIPHHGAKDLLGFVEKLSPYQGKKAVATTTVFLNEHPYREALDKYDVICEHVSSTDRGEKPFGRIQLSFNISRMYVPAPILAGNARKVRPK